MRGDERLQAGMFSYVSLEPRVPQDHPLRTVRELTDAVLRTLSAEFDGLYANSGRPSIAPEYILRALLLQVFCSVRSERLLVEQIDYNLLFRWFVCLSMDDDVWNHAVFSKNRERLLTSDVDADMCGLKDAMAGNGGNLIHVESHTRKVGQTKVSRY
jgi:transposase